MNWLRDLLPQSFKNVYHFFQAAVAVVFYRFPSKNLKVIGVTGTDGKTTTVSLIYHILKTAGIKVSMISTVKAKVGEASFDIGFHVTTPSPFELQKILRMMIKAGSEVAVVEVTSHGLDQNRLAFVDFFTGLITNITHEHLDYHKSYDSYVKTKAKILNNVKYRVLNFDDSSFERLKETGSGKMISFGFGKEADFIAKDINYKKGGTDFTVKLKTANKSTGSIQINSPLIGDFNAYNVLAAIACAKTLNIDQRKIQEAIKTFPGVEGRLEEVANNKGIKVVVDFAHTPNSFERTLKILKEQTDNNLVCVFGSAGSRDRTKRPIMGELAGRYCNYTVITAEDPRYEDVNKISGEIAKGLEKAGGVLNKTYWKMPDRAEAIKGAVGRLATNGDTVAILGKGHERSISILGVEYPWSDKEVAADALERITKK